ncbi:MAG TPA: ABC transporter ATP-binding protein [Candidatus Didemnitutus sp.]|nr:ABC transporter ATP-binding protein [Candidatus Didemnitutus sp.]
MNHAASNGDYRRQSPAVAERFRKLKERPVVLEIDHLGREFPTEKGTVTALKDISFRVHRREFVCVIGPSGCGKSTLIRMVAGLDRPTSGRMLLDGEEVSGPCPSRGMVFQGYTLFPWLTVTENVMFGLRMEGKTAADALPDALQWIDLVGLRRFKDAYPVQLSGGMKQRTAIARALANNPRILLMDEPFGALDAQTRLQMQTHLMEIWRNVDVTILFITHDLDEAVLLADRILVLKAHPGEVQEVIEVPVPRPRSPAQMTTPEFQATRRRLDELIHPLVTAAPAEKLPIVRLTQAGDDVE